MAKAPGRDRRCGGMRAVIVVIVVGLGVVAGVFVPSALRATGLWIDGGSPSISPTVFTLPPTPSALPDEGVVGAADPIRQRASAAPAVLAAKIAALPADGIGTSAWVVTDASGRGVAGSSATTPMMPASTLKMLTALVALDSMPAEKRFRTSVKRGSTGSIVLVGGGDPLLATRPVADAYPRPSSLADLADLTAAALRRSNETSVTLGFDAGMFNGLDWQPTWEPVFETDVTRISSLIADVGVIDAVNGVRTKTPALTAAEAFAVLLRERGIEVAGAPAARAGTGADIAFVDSLPLHVLVQQALMHSDNTVTEIVLRHAAIASGNEASFAGGVKTIQQHLTRLGVWQTGAVLHDGSGISRANRVSPLMLAKAIRIVLDDPAYRVLLDAMPVAGATGTLRNRFTEPGSGAGRGWVRAKTGSLRDASSLAGFARTADGQNLVLAFMTNAVPNTWKAKAWIDGAASAVASCGCR